MSGPDLLTRACGSFDVVVAPGETEATRHLRTEGPVHIGSWQAVAWEVLPGGRDGEHVTFAIRVLRIAHPRHEVVLFEGEEYASTGVDVVDCSSGGNSPRGATNANLQRAPGYQAPFAARIRRESGIQTMAVGLIREPELAERLLQEGCADLIAIGRQFLYDPFWAHHAAQHFGLTGDFERWPQPYAWWLEKWEKGLRASGFTL